MALMNTRKIRFRIRSSTGGEGKDADGMAMEGEGTETK